jgi:hypothetical protein
MKDSKIKSESSLSAAKKWITLRATASEKNRLVEQANIAGLSVSEYMRRRFFGGRPLIARTDEMMIRELRRIGGLLKYNFATLRETGASKELLQLQEEALRMIVLAIDTLGVRHARRLDKKRPQNDGA